MDRDTEAYLIGHCNYLTFGYCHTAACVREGKKRDGTPYCIPLEIFNHIKELEAKVSKRVDVMDGVKDATQDN